MTDKALKKPQISDLQTLLQKIPTQKLLCIGDLMLDRFFYGKVERISPEAPIPVMKIDREVYMLGGAGNAAANMASLKIPTVLAGIVGNDEAAQTVRQHCRDMFGSDDLILTDDKRPTTVKSRFVAQSQQLLRCDWEDDKEISTQSLNALQKELSSHIETVQAILISDYGKGLLNKDLCQFIIKTAKARNIPVIVDPKGRDYSKYNGATLIKPNKKELSEATGLALKTDEDVVQACKELIENHDLQALLATRGGEGMTLVTRDHHIEHIPSITREVFDVSGAGDTVAAVITASIAVTPDFLAASLLGNYAGNIVVGKAGTAKIHMAELEQIIIEQMKQSGAKYAVSGLEKLYDWETAKDKVYLWQSQNLKVGFTNGCFDLVHPGHLSLIEQARRQCDRLILAINSDASVQKLKGPTRPVQNEDARAAVLGSLSNVDMVVIFDQDTPMELLETLRPDLLVKGSDYTIDKVVGAEFVQSYGGSVFLADIQDGFSTTKTIQKMAS